MGERGCGYRVQGGVYIEVGLSPFGKPVEAFLLDPPIPVPDGFGLPTQGVLIRERPTNPGVFDVYDRVGTSGYPNVCDVIEETRQMGASRRIQRNAEFDLLSPESRLILIHDRAILTGRNDYYETILMEVAEGIRVWWCPKDVDGHDKSNPSPGGAENAPPYERFIMPPMCVGLYWEDVEGGTQVKADAKDARLVTRTVGSTTYEARRRPDHVYDGARIGMFLSLPISNIAVIRADDGSHEDAASLARRSSLAVEIEDA